jgi:hypothetical protein
LLLQIAVSLGLIAYVLSTIDLREVVRPIPRSGWAYIAGIVALANLDRIWMAYKWNLLLKARGLVLPFVEVVKGYYIGTFWGIVLPSSLGGDAVRVYRTSSLTKAPEGILSSVVMERVLGLLSTLIMVGAGAAIYVWYLGRADWTMFVGMVALLAVGLGLFWLSLQGSVAGRFGLGTGSPDSGWRRRLAGLFSAYQAYRHSPEVIARFIILSLGEQCVPVVCMFLMSLALGLSVSLQAFFAVTPLIMGLSRIPISFDGYGVREGLYVYTLSQIGVPAGDALLVGFLAHVIGNVALLPGYLWSALTPSSAGAVPTPAAPE